MSTNPWDQLMGHIKTRNYRSLRKKEKLRAKRDKRNKFTTKRQRSKTLKIKIQPKKKVLYFFQRRDHGPYSPQE